jgi:hypothetical protein
MGAVTRTRPALTPADLTPLARAALGTDRTLVSATRLRGGSKKGVYRLTCDDGTTAVAYVWSPEEDYWDPGAADPRDPFSHASGLNLFTAAQARLTALGVRTPRPLLTAPAGTHLPVDAAVVEDVPGGTLEEALRRDPAAARPALERLARAIPSTCRLALAGKVEARQREALAAILGERLVLE